MVLDGTHNDEAWKLGVEDAIRMRGASEAAILLREAMEGQLTGGTDETDIEEMLGTILLLGCLEKIGR